MIRKALTLKANFNNSLICFCDIFVESTVNDMLAEKSAMLSPALFRMSLLKMKRKELI